MSGEIQTSIVSLPRHPHFGPLEKVSKSVKLCLSKVRWFEWKLAMVKVVNTCYDELEAMRNWKISGRSLVLRGTGELRRWFVRRTRLERKQ